VAERLISGLWELALIIQHCQDSQALFNTSAQNKGQLALIIQPSLSLFCSSASAAHATGSN
jgi:hypothetical protein